MSSSTVVVRYRTRPEAADENARLVQGVYAALADLAPDGFRYATHRLAVGVTFVHVAHHSGSNPLPDLPAFAEFQRHLAGRCVDGPEPSQASVVGSYGWRER